MPSTGKCRFQSTAPGFIDRFLSGRPSVLRLDWRESGKNGHLNVAATTARATEVSDRDASVAVSCALYGLISLTAYARWLSAGGYYFRSWQQDESEAAEVLAGCW
jgi:hypothetical protein